MTRKCLSKSDELRDALYDLGEAVLSALAYNQPLEGWEIGLLETRLERVKEVHRKEDYVSDPDSEPLGN